MDHTEIEQEIAKVLERLPGEFRRRLENVAIVVEKTSPGVLDLGALGNAPQAFIRIDDVELAFVPRPRNDDVQV